jgi:TP901 family phage tail tape measure protein
MARDLRIQLILDTIDRATAPLRSISTQTRRATDSLRQARDAHKQLRSELGSVEEYQKIEQELGNTNQRLAQHRESLEQTRAEYDRQKAVHDDVESQLKASQRRYRELSRAIMRGEHVSQEYRDELERVRAESTLLQRQFDRSSTRLGSYRNTINSTERSISTLAQRESTLTTALASQRQRLDRAGISTDNLADTTAELRRRVEQSTESINRQRAALEQLQRREQAIARNRARIQSMRDAGGKIAAHGAGMTATGAVAGAGLAASLRPGIDYGAQKSAVQAITRLQADDARLAALHKQSADLGASTSYTSTEVAQGQEFLARAGYSPEAILASMSDVLALAKANRIELAQAADIASNISGAFRLDPESEGAMQRVADVLTATTTRANVDMQMLGETMKYLGQASDLNMSLEQAAAMAGMLGNIGIQGSEGGTTLRAMLTRLAAPVGPAQEALQELNVSVADTNGNLRQIPDILGDIYAATSKMGNVGRASYLKDIFGEEPGSGMALLIEQQGKAGIDKFAEILRSVKGENAQVAGVMSDNLAGDLAGLSSAIDSISNVLTDANNGPLRELVKVITENVRAVSSWMQENPEATRRILMLAGGAAALLVVLGTLLTTVGLATMGVATMASGFLKLASVIATVSKLFLANPILAAVTAIAVAAYLIYDNWDTIGPYFQKLWAFVQDIILKALQAIKTLINKYSPVGIIYNLIKSGLDKIGVELPETFTEFGANMMQGLIKGLKSMLPDVSATVGDIGNSVSSWFKETLGIHSPSRVFIRHGSDVMAGLEKGLEQNADQALKPVDKLQRNLTAIGAGLTISTIAIGPVAAVESATGPRLAAGAASSAVTIQIRDINIHPTPGMDERALAALVRTEIERVTREQLMRQRTRMRDVE